MDSKTRGGTPRVTFRIGRVRRDFEQRIDDASRSIGASTAAELTIRELLRYYELLRAGRQEVLALALTVDEAYRICDALRINDDSEAALGGKPTTLSPLGRAALRDSVERFWTNLGSEDTDRLLRTLELVPPRR